MSVVYDMTIEEREGLRRSIVLRGRSLPFQGVAFPSHLRVDNNYFPGNPVAESQVTGPVWKPTSMNGRWSDIFLFETENAAKLINFPALQTQAQPGGGLVAGASFKSGGAVPDQEARTARALRDAFYKIQRSGMHLRCEWASIVRFGYIIDFTPSIEREEDVDWELEWDWTGDTENQPVPAPRRQDLTSLLKKIMASMAEVISTLSAPLYELEAWRSKITQTVTLFAQFTAELLGTLERLTAFALAPQELFGTIRSTLQGIRLAANDLITTFTEVSAAVLLSAVGDPALVASQNALQALTRRLLVRLAKEGRLNQDAIDAFNSPRILAIEYAIAGQTLRDLSTAHYGTANHWREIMDFNGLASSVVPTGSVIRVPIL